MISKDWVWLRDTKKLEAMHIDRSVDFKQTVRVAEHGGGRLDKKA